MNREVRWKQRQPQVSRLFFSLQFQWGTRDSLIFLIDSSKSMFEDAGDEGNGFEKCIKVCLIKITIQLRHNRSPISFHVIRFVSFIINVFQCAKSVIQNKVIANEKDLIGIVFFGTVSYFGFLRQNKPNEQILPSSGFELWYKY